MNIFNEATNHVHEFDHETQLKACLEIFCEDRISSLQAWSHLLFVRFREHITDASDQCFFKPDNVF